MLSLTSCSVTRKSIDLKDFVTVTFDSYNGFSSPEMEVDYQLLSHEFDTEKMVKFFKKVCPEDAQVYNEFGDDKNGNGKLISTYFAKAKPGVACEKGKVGSLVAIYESMGGLFGSKKEMYVIEADSIIKNSDGELRFKTYDGYLYSQGSTEQEAYNNSFGHENYTFEKIK